MKRFLITLLFLPIILTAQEIEVKISIEWAENQYPLIFKTENRTPYLIISMTNKSDECLNVLNPLSSSYNVPSIQIGFTSHSKDQYFLKSKKELLKLYKINKEPHNVFIGYGFIDVLDIESYKYYEETGEIDMPGSYLAVMADELNKFFILQNFLNFGEVNRQSKLFKYNQKRTLKGKVAHKKFKSILFDEDVLNYPKRICLNPNENIKLKYNLMGFKILGGSYSFIVKQNHTENDLNNSYFKNFEDCKPYSEMLESNIILIDW